VIIEGKPDLAGPSTSVEEVLKLCLHEQQVIKSNEDIVPGIRLFL
jgi:hypothetical protein